MGCRRRTGVGAPGSPSMRRELRIEDVGLRWWGKCLLCRRARGVKLESKVKEIRRHQGVLTTRFISSEPSLLVWCELVVARPAPGCLRLELELQPRQWGSSASFRFSGVLSINGAYLSLYNRYLTTSKGAKNLDQTIVFVLHPRKLHV